MEVEGQGSLELEQRCTPIFCPSYVLMHRKLPRQTDTNRLVHGGVTHIWSGDC